MDVLERFLRYVSFDTQSSEESGTTPSTQKQKLLGQALADELRALGLADARMDRYGYVYAHLPATPGREGEPCLGLIAHMDTSPSASGEAVKPQVVRYEGGDLPLNRELGVVMELSRFPMLAKYVGQELVVTDGTTLLGADDKAGIAEIITTVGYLLAHPEREHGPIAIGFTPDEEIGEGADYFDLDAFGAAAAYTVDGGELGELNYENFNAAGAKITVHGLSVHPGSAKDTMKNAALIACQLVGMLPPAQVPEHTQGREGFYHLCDLAGDVTEAQLSVIIRDHDKEKFQARKDLVKNAVEFLNHQYGEGTVELELKDSYYNMREPLQEHMELVEKARAAMEKVGITPVEEPIRGGTDGARLTFMGLPCPNLSTGGFNFHGVHEAIPVEAMEKMVEVLLHLAAPEQK
ncbi:MAG: peptidase T [Angelakisella sp.]|nr:peptidase T [Angelakisella sp.]